ncbi:MAG: AMP-binding protein, partial [Clostridia bacterium]|nr:AMP-binding protein [Clostridia bacterium]
TVRIDGTTVNDKGLAEGEIIVKGDNVMLGYYRNEEANASAFTEDGWYRTGDVGYMDKDGYIFITGRMKSVIVLDNGKNVFPEEIEEYIGRIPGIVESVVVGRKNEEGSVVLTALIVPDYDFYKDKSPEEIEAKIKEDIRSMNKKLAAFKQVKTVEIREEPFEKTTSRKIKRHLVK